MKLISSIFINPIEIKDDKVNVLILESQAVFAEFIAEIFEQINNGIGSLLLVHDDKKLDLAKSMDMVVDIFSLTVNQKKVITKLHNKLITVAREAEYYLPTNELLTNINIYLNQIIKSEDLSLTYNETFDMAGIFKIADVKFSEEKNCLPEKLLDYMEVMTDYCGIKCFVFVNLKSYIAPAVLKDFYKNLLYQKFRVLLLENKLDDDKALRNFEKILILDKDLCEI